MANHLDAVFFALSDPTRRSVIERLAGGPTTVKDLHAPLGIALPTFLRHLRVLEDAGLIRTEKRGRVRSVQLAVSGMRPARDWLAARDTTRDRPAGHFEAVMRKMKRDGPERETPPSPADGPFSR